MHTFERDGVALDRCADCGGLWFDRGELRRVTGRSVRVLPEPDASALHCARCPGAALHAARVDGEALSGCPRCAGLFLTPPVLARLRGPTAPTVRLTGPVRFTCDGCHTGAPVSTSRRQGRQLLCTRCAPSTLSGSAPSTSAFTEYVRDVAVGAAELAVVELAGAALETVLEALFD